MPSSFNPNLIYTRNTRLVRDHLSFLVLPFHFFADTVLFSIDFLSKTLPIFAIVRASQTSESPGSAANPHCIALANEISDGQVQMQTDLPLSCQAVLETATPFPIYSGSANAGIVPPFPVPHGSATPGFAPLNSASQLLNMPGCTGLVSGTPGTISGDPLG